MKLIDLLVKELPKRGGWPSNALSVAQDSEGYCWGYMCKRLTLQSHGWWRSKSGDAICTDRIMIDEMASDWDSSFVTRTQYESSLAASEGWIEWHGGKCPVDSDAIVEVRYRKPNQYQYNNDRAGDFSWAHDGIDGDIIAYRLHDQGIKHRANDDQLEQDLNECIGQDVGPTWNGDGLPPVGVECEWLASGDHEWIAVTVLCYDGEDAWLKPSDGSQSFVVWNVDNFRPLSTEAEKAREAAETAMRTCLAGTGAGIAPMAAKGVYDAIAAGKIPGVKLEGK